MKKFLRFNVVTALMIAAVGALHAQVVTTSPAIVQADSKNIVITFHAGRGNGELQGQPSTAAIYAHTGVITSKSTGDGDWKYAPSWSQNLEKYKMTYAGPDTWTLTIPDIKSFYGITSSDETVKKLAFVFRNSNGSLTGKTAEGGDIFVDVLPDGFEMALTSTPDASVVMGDEPVTFEVNTTQPADISLYLYDTEAPAVAHVTDATVLQWEHSFTQSGDYDVIAVAKTGTEVRTAMLSVTRLSNATAQDYPGGTPVMGAVTGADGKVTFCLAAPGKDNVIVVGSWNDYKINSAAMMKYQDYNGQRYFWTTIDGLENGRDYLYYYIVDGTVKVGDPYARLVLDPWNDRYIPSSVFPDMPAYPADKVSNVPLAVYNSDADIYNWQVKDFKRPAQSDLVIYELLIRDFTGTEGRADASGTIKGVMSKIEYLKNLGVNAIELLPIMEFNGNNSWGYNTNFYFAPDKAYGTPDDYRRLIDECHARGMAVILDIVFNQSDGLHPWYQMYPIDKNPFYNGSAPHAYSVLNDWNQDNPLVLQQEKDALAYWLEAYNVDGFRFDLVKGLGSNESYKNTYNPTTNTFGTPNDANTNAYNASRVARMAELQQTVQAVSPGAYFINENLAGAKEENEMAQSGETNWANINEPACEFAMGYSGNSSLNRFYAPLDSRTWGSTVSYAESHDEERMAYKQQKYGASGVKGNNDVSMRRLGSVAAQMLMTPGSHMIWQFQEFGADQTTKNSSGNDTSPKKVIWSYLDKPANAGLMQNYKELCWIRRDNPQFFTEQTATSVNLSAWNGRTVVLTAGEEELALIVNPGVSENATIASGLTNDLSTYKVLSSSYGTSYSFDGKSVNLEPGAYIVLGSGNLVGIDKVTNDNGAQVSVSGGNGCISITGDYGSAACYTITGRRVGLDSHLLPGIYIVNVDGRGYKVKVN